MFLCLVNWDIKRVFHFTFSLSLTHTHNHTIHSQSGVSLSLDWTSTLCYFILSCYTDLKPWQNDPSMPAVVGSHNQERPLRNVVCVHCLVFRSMVMSFSLEEWEHFITVIKSRRGVRFSFSLDFLHSCDAFASYV